MALGWGKEKRLLKRADFSLCYDRGDKVHSRHFLAFIYLKEDQAFPRVGMAVTKKMGNAVARNRLKRLLREYCRRNQNSFPSTADIVITPKRHINPYTVTYCEVEKDLHGLFKKSHE